MDSNTRNIRKTRSDDQGELLNARVKFEKEKLVSMFLINATISELADQYRLIDELNAKIADLSRS